ncbi:MAG: phosphoribosylformylglycinamidine cyclo-ligase [Planctomycetota bacterium]
MVTYKDSGVSLKNADEAVDRISKYVRSTYSPKVLTGSHGGFAGMFQLDYPAGILRKAYRQPVLVACTDGVGTKLEVAYKTGIADTIGIDLVAMCVNDLIVQGAEPLFFLDYIAVGKLEPELVAQVVKGIADGCRESGCAILGGETAEMPGFYPENHYELAGFSVGVVEKSRVINGRNVQPGDDVIGIPSSGIHSNGYSLVRKVFLSGRPKKSVLERELKGCELPLGRELLRPTRLYVKPLLKIIRKYRTKKPIKALAHITGGGLEGNVPRVLPPGMDVVIDKKSWKIPPIFRHLKREGKVPEREMFRVFNMGIGMVMVTSPHFTSSILDQLADAGYPSYKIGKVTKGKGKLRFQTK